MNIKRISRILFVAAGIAVAVFILCVIFWGSEENATTWRVFSVCMPVVGVCFTGAVIAAVIDFIKKQ